MRKNSLSEISQIICSIIENTQNGPLKIKNSKIRARHINHMLIWVQKDIWVQEILLFEEWVMGGGSKLKVQGKDSYSVNECIHLRGDI